MYRHTKQYITAGAPVANAKGALVMLHGRGGTAQNIATLADSLNVADLAVFAPQATNQSWYPYSFMAPESSNQPALDSTIETVAELVKHIESQGIPADKICFLGFSQGACVALEYVARNAKRYGWVVAFTGGLIGEQLDTSRYTGDFNGTPILITTGNPDPHVPLSRVEDSVQLLEKLHAKVTLQVYNGKQHTITLSEIKLADNVIFSAQAI